MNRVRAQWHGFKLWWVVRDENGQFVAEFNHWDHAVAFANSAVAAHINNVDMDDVRDFIRHHVEGDRTGAVPVLIKTIPDLLTLREEILEELEPHQAALKDRLAEVDYLLGWPPKAGGDTDVHTLAGSQN